MNGPNAHPVYQYLRMNSPLYNAESQTASEIPWNFAKFLVNKDGEVVKFYAHGADPMSMMSDIEGLLNQ